jgi:hypothetical protein
MTLYRNPVNFYTFDHVLTKVGPAIRTTTILQSQATQDAKREEENRQEQA